MRYTLHVFCELRFSVERLALLDFVDHFSHIHLDLATVFAGTIEAV